jgi:hypothetical protein
MNVEFMVEQNESAQLPGATIGSALLVDSMWRPFRARRAGVRFPGLKPWAESCCPFGAGPSGRRDPR